MARGLGILILLTIAFMEVSGMRKQGKRGGKKQGGSSVVTCPGFPGYCSESYVGDTCLVVCARGRNNVPQCQADGTWTDIPRCIEHEPGQDEQRTEHCPGIPGYCSLDLPGGLCTFECPVGPHIRSSCTVDGTWEPYPTCQGDLRETQDGCNPCPGPVGRSRNRTLEATGGNSGGGGGGRVGGGGGGRFGGGRGRSGAGANKIGGGGGRKQGGGGGGGNKGHGGDRRGGNGGGHGRKQGGGNGGARGGGGGGASCPGAQLQACIDVCPGSNARVFGACVAGCAKRCNNK